MSNQIAKSIYEFILNNPGSIDIDEGEAAIIKIGDPNI